MNDWMCIYIEEETSRLEVNGATLLVLTVIYNGQVPYQVSLPRKEKVEKNIFKKTVGDRH